MPRRDRVQLYNLTQLPYPVSSDQQRPTTFIPRLVLPYLPSARRGLSSHFLNQSVSRPCNRVSTTIYPQYHESSILASSTGERLYGGDLNCEGYPGFNVRVVFCRLGGTFEDGFIMSRGCAARFTYRVEAVVILSTEKAKGWEVGTSVPANGISWWGIPVPGYAEQTVRLGYDRVRLAVSRACTATAGDKLCALMGEKGVVTVLEDAQMPYMMEGDTRVPFELVMGSTAVT